MTHPYYNMLYIDRETREKYGLDCTVIDMAAAEISHVLGEKVCRITGWSVKTGHIWESDNKRLNARLAELKVVKS